MGNNNDDRLPESVMIAGEKWDICTGATFDPTNTFFEDVGRVRTSWIYYAERRIDFAEGLTPAVMRAELSELVRDLAANWRMWKGMPRPSRRTYPADALGIRVELVDGPILCDEDGSRCVAKIVDDTTIHVAQGAPPSLRRRAAAECRHILAEELPEGELEPLATDLAEAWRKLVWGDWPTPTTPLPADAEIRPVGPYNACPVISDKHGRRYCPCCGKGFRYVGTLANHLKRIHGCRRSKDIYFMPPAATAAGRRKKAGGRP